MSVKPIFEKKNILITGGAGFIGSHLCDELLKTCKVICLDNFISGSEQNIDHLLQNPDFEFVRHDINQPVDLEALPELEKFRIKFQGLQEVYHLACPTAPKGFEGKIVETALANSVGVKNALDLAVKYQAKFIFASSSVVYGARQNKEMHFKEVDLGLVDQLSRRASYDEGKRFGETMVSTYQQAYGLDAKIARIFRTYGSRMMLEQGHMLPDFVFSALDDKDLVVYGDKGFASSFCHVSDLVQGLIKLMASAESGPINLGSDIDCKIIDVAQKIIALAGSKSKIIFAAEQLFMTPLVLPDITAAKEKLGWFPVTLLDDGLQETIDYFKAHKSIIKPGTNL